MVNFDASYDVLVVGGGNAALCAALSARERGARVLLLEQAPGPVRGGNSKHTRNLRCMHRGPTDVLTDSYLEEEYWDDLMQVTGGNTNEELAAIAIRGSEDITEWMVEQGVRFQPSLGGTLSLSRTNAFFLGGGKALVNAYYLRAEQCGVEIAYHSEVKNLKIRAGCFESARVASRGYEYQVKAKCLIVASGGFQANGEWMRQAWGASADHFIIRGTPYAQGRMLEVLLANGAKSVGEANQCHAVAIDARAPKYDGGIVTRLDCVPFGIVVNKEAKRFYDEGEDFWPKRYAIWGRLVAEQPQQIGYCVIDAKSIDNFMPSVFPPIRANSLSELADKLGLDPEALLATVETYNTAVCPGDFDSTRLDDCRTEGLKPEKTHWARTIDTPPYYGYPLRPGITFTYMGVAVNNRARIMMNSGIPAANMYAAGEIMAGNILSQGYLAGIGMTIGSVFGRIAGEEAGNAANRNQ